jgi:outer membrane lipoprotein-sorting protein
MNCAESKELMVAYIEDLLDEKNKRLVSEHLKDCTFCQAELKEISNLRDRLVKNGKVLAGCDVENVVLDRIIREQNVRLKATAKIGTGLKIRRIIMKSRIVKLAAAAVIVVGIFAVINFFVGTGGSVALADVLEKVEQVQAFMYKIKMSMTGNMQPGMPTGKQEMEGAITISNNYGMKMEMTTADANTGQKRIIQQMYLLPEKRMMIMVMPEEKKFMRMEFDEDLLSRMKRQNNDPREVIKQTMNCRYVDLGRSRIDGVEVEGFQTTDPAFLGGETENVKVTLWVDVEKQLPVRIEMDLKMNEQMQMSGVVFDFQWDVPVDANEFEPVIPADFTAFPTDGMKIPSMTEEAAIEGLKFFADIAGQYPRSINLMSLMQETASLKDSNTPAAEQLRLKLKEAGSEEQQAAIIMKMMQPVQSLGMFYMALVQDKKEPVYYGDKVTPEFGHAVLMHWKKDEGKYRVIFGDLTAEDVNAQRLAELESMPLNTKPYAIKPQPADKIVGTAIVSLELKWMPGAYVTEHQVYFGASANELSLLAEVNEPNFAEIPVLERGATYYWRVDEVQPDGSIADGDVWSFNTGGLVGWWKFDEGSGSTAVDSSGNSHNGTLKNMDDRDRVDGALYLDGKDSFVSIPPLNLNSNTVTISAWIRRDGEQKEAYTGLVYCRDGNTTAGFNLGGTGAPDWKINDELAYNWNETQAAWDWHNGLIVPDNKWVFAALVVEPTRATLYMGEDGRLTSATNMIDHSIEEFDGVTRIGHDTHTEGRYFKGTIDDMRIYNCALSQDEVEALYEAR